MGGWYNPRFRKPPRKGGRGRPPLQRGRDGCEAYTTERIRIVTNDILRGGQYNTYVFLRPTEGSSGTPTPTGGCVTDVLATIQRRRKRQPAGRRGRRPLRVVFDLYRLHAPPGSIRTRGRKRRKSLIRGGGSIRPRGQKRLKSQKGWRGAFTPFRLFRTESVFSHPPAYTHAREGGDALPYKHPITSEKPPGTSPGG